MLQSNCSQTVKLGFQRAESFDQASLSGPVGRRPNTLLVAGQRHAYTLIDAAQRVTHVCANGAHRKRSHLPIVGNPKSKIQNPKLGTP
jgi:hypothetical protein